MKGRRIIMNKVNLNEIIQFNFTDRGHMLFDEYLLKLQSEMGDKVEVKESSFLSYNDQGFVEMQLWKFMNIFGDSFYTGANPVVKDNVIYFK
jgi:hypothetical protein